MKITHWGHWDTNIPETDTPEAEELVVNELAKNRYCFSGFDHQNPEMNCVPYFDNGTCYLALLRVWGHLMSDAQNKILNEVKFKYINFAWSLQEDEKTIAGIEKKYPDGEKREQEQEET